MATSLSPSALLRLLSLGLLLLARAALWLIPGLFLVSLSLFAILARNAPNRSELPLYFNPNPSGADSRAKELVERLRLDNASQADRDALVQGGSALLPHILPRLDTLPPDQRMRVAAALLPIAKRMGIVDQPIAAEQAAAFWARYWSARGMDYRAAITKRAVKRLARGANPLRRAEVRELDTFALPELMDAIDDPLVSGTPEALAALTQAAQHITGNPWTYETSLRESGQAASVTPQGQAISADDVRGRWQDWWLRQRQQFEVYRGTRQLGAMVEQTLYARWVLQVMSPRFWKGPQSPWPKMREGLPPTLTLLLAAWVGRLTAAWLIRTRARHLRRRRLRWLLLALSFVPPVSLGAIAQALGLSSLLVASILASWCGFALRLHHSDVYRHEFESREPRYWPSMFWLSWALSAVIALELALQIEGLGQQTFAALRRHDLNWLMLLALGSVTLTGLVDAVLRALETQRILRLESLYPPPAEEPVQ